MTDFDYDVLQKKRTASGAYHRKGGSKSKKCSLPSDHLTEAQKRKLNGPMTSVNLNQPISWKDFKPLSDSLKKSYLINLLNTYQPSCAAIADMMHISAPCVRMEMRRLGLPVGQPGGDQNSGNAKARKAAWAAFCNGVVGGGDNSITPNANSIIPEENDRIEPADDRIEAPRKVWDLDSPDHINARRCEDPVEESIYEEVEWPGDELNIPENEATEAEHGFENRCCDGVMTSLSIEYSGNATSVSRLMANMMTLFNGTRIKVKLSIEVVE